MEIINVGKDNFDKEVLNSEKMVLIDFNANWCGPCRMLRPILDEISTENNTVKIVSINIDNEEDLARNYGVMSIPCLVLVEKGQEIRRSVGLMPKEEVIKFIGE